jgi:hypothetical protein
LFPKAFSSFVFYSIINLGTGKIANGDGHFEVHLPFAGITLFRFDGCNLSLQIFYGSTPGKSVRYFEICWAELLNAQVSDTTEVDGSYTASLYKSKKDLTDLNCEITWRNFNLL